MAMREQFGDYVLLKKLTEDPLGETFRAGKAGPDGLERVLLLKVFNGDNVDGDTLGRKMRERAQVQKVLKSPNIAEGVDLGQLHGTPYVAYEYVSGRDLASLLAEVARQGNPAPTDQALLIAERIALGLAVAYEHRLGQERILHGFLVPHLVVISNEGETRVLGFEPAPALRGVVASSGAKKEFARYLSPEAVAGDPPDKGDDVYSLGVILYELLTGERMPTTPGDELDLLVDRASLAHDDSPMPAPLAGLLKQSLGPAERRIGDVVTWHKTLSKLMFEGQHSPTTFNLAFFMHNLFRSEIERESQEIEAERTIKLEARHPARKAEGTEAPPEAAGGELAGEESTDAVRQRYAIEHGEAKRGKGLYLGIAAAVVVALGIGAFLVFSDWAPGGEDPDAVAAAAAPEPVVPVEPEGPDPQELALQQQQELEAQLRQMIEERTEAMGERYEQELRALESQLAEARRTAEQAAAEREALEREAEARAVEPATPEPEPAAEPEAAPARPAEPAREPAPERPAVAEERPATPPFQEPAVAEAPPEPEPVREPEPPAVERGELVEMGPGVVPPVLLQQPQVRYPAAAARMRQEAKVPVRVLIDENGRVLETELIGERQGFGFDDAALRAAPTARFRPATKHGVPVKIWYTLEIEFRLGS